MTIVGTHMHDLLNVTFVTNIYCIRVIKKILFLKNLKFTRQKKKKFYLREINMGSIETQRVIGSVIEINRLSEIKSDSPTQPHDGKKIDKIVARSNCPTQPHNGKKIDQIIVSQYIDDDPYAVTYSKEDHSIH